MIAALAAAAAALAIAFIGAAAAYRGIARKRTRHVVRLADYRRSQAGKTAQKCSSCGKTAKLRHYALENGSVAGFCPACRVQAEKRGLLPL
jgi:hypothetical protein